MSPARENVLFQMKAHAVATLNLPQVCVLYHVGHDCLAMERVEPRGCRFHLSRTSAEVAVNESDSIGSAPGEGWCGATEWWAGALRIEFIEWSRPGFGRGIVFFVLNQF